MTDAAETVNYKALIAEAQQHLEKGAVIKAMQIYYDLHERDPNSTEVLRRLVGINLHMEIHDQAIINLQKLIQLDPLQSAYYDQLAEVYGKLRDWDEACETYYGLILRTPKLPEAHFNLAFYLRRAGKFEESIDSYQRALRYGIKQAEEVHLNIAVIYADDLRKEAEAEEHLHKALKLNEHYIPALYNLANLHEDRGDREETIGLFRRILATDPANAKAMARLAPLTVDNPALDPLVPRLYEASKSKGVSLSDKIDVLYALGKVHNDCEEYDLAFDNYSAANALNALEFQPYDTSTAETYFQQIIDTVTPDWIAANQRAGDEQPVFICGMFRSGSTLVEQMLAAHPEITAGGERDTLIRELTDPVLQYPAGLASLEKTALHDIADRY
ncbi:MAG: tetratricopeptide repeat protein, partial [Woeseiaceae bacterium]